MIQVKERGQLGRGQMLEESMANYLGMGIIRLDYPHNCRERLIEYGLVDREFFEESERRKHIQQYEKSCRMGCMGCAKAPKKDRGAIEVPKEKKKKAQPKGKGKAKPKN